MGWKCTFSSIPDLILANTSAFLMFVLTGVVYYQRFPFKGLTKFLAHSLK